MIGSLRGQLEEVATAGEAAAEIVVDVGGVGYVLSVAMRTALDLGPPGTTVKLAVYTHVRESAITLYGFADRTERRCFEVLIGTHGVGPALALAVLGVLGPDGLTRAIATGDEAALTLVPGVGRKTAQRLLVELGSRLDALGGTAGDLGAGLVRGAGAGAGGGSPAGSLSDTNVATVAEALAALGYAPEEVRSALRTLPDGERPEVLLRHALRQLAGRP